MIHSLPSRRRFPVGARLALGLLAFAMIACGGDGPAAPTDGKKIFYDARRSAHKSLDPPRQFDGASS